jgi:hypothetical protein
MVLADYAVYLRSGLTGACSELSHFVGDDGEAAALLAGPSGLDCRVECQKIGLPCYGAYCRNDIFDALRMFIQLTEQFGGAGHTFDDVVRRRARGFQRTSCRWCRTRFACAGECRPCRL